MAAQTTTTCLVTPLGESNYNNWMPEMRAYLAEQKVWFIGSAEDTQPQDAAASTTWRNNAAAAAGAIYGALEPSQRVHVVGIEMDPVKMWAKLESVHRQKVSGARFNALDALLAVRKGPEESLPSIIARVDSCMQELKSLRPDHYTITELDDDLAAMAMIRSLGPEYIEFSSSLVRYDPSRSDVVQAFVREHNHRLPRAGTADNAAYRAQAPPSSSKGQNVTCDFCGYTGHSEDTCHRKAAAKEQTRKDIAERKASRRQGRPQGAKAATTASDSSSTVEVAGQAFTVELADNASAALPSTPLSAVLDASSADWTADTGATAHMTPHRHWFASYTPCNVPIRLADSKVVYAAGIGTVRFRPCVEGQQLRVGEFTRVLHVPELRSNLLSVLYLTQHKAIHVSIDHGLMSFVKGDRLLFTASVSDSNCALLNGCCCHRPPPCTARQHLRPGPQSMA